jgi:hypothetical protein
MLTIFWRESGSEEILIELCKHNFLKTASATNIWSQEEEKEQMKISNSCEEKSVQNKRRNIVIWVIFFCFLLKWWFLNQ